jgi:hypothetical protein
MIYSLHQSHRLTKPNQLHNCTWYCTNNNNSLACAIRTIYNNIQRHTPSRGGTPGIWRNITMIKTLAILASIATTCYAIDATARHAAAPTPMPTPILSVATQAQQAGVEIYAIDCDDSGSCHVWTTAANAQQPDWFCEASSPDTLPVCNFTDAPREQALNITKPRQSSV